MASEDDLLRIVGEIYGAVGSPIRWAACLESIRRMFRATAAHLLHHDHHSHDGGISAAAGLDPTAMQAYVEHYHRVDPWATNVRLDAVPVGNVILGQSPRHRPLPRSCEVSPSSAIPMTDSLPANPRWNDQLRNVPTVYLSFDRC